MKKGVLWIIIIVLILIIAYIVTPKDSIENDSDYMIAGFNDQIVITLDANPTTGYTWDIDFDDEYLSFTKKEFIPGAVGEDIVGVGGLEKFIFNPTKVGKTELIFNYQREWEDEEPIETQHFKYKIIE
jgi:inhibitor of cysteine peptidase